MRNLKRALSLTLASIMLLGMMVVGSSAASYKDVTDDHNVEAIEVLQAVGIMVGDDGNFNPDKNVTRNEMAVIMSNLMDYRAASYSGTSPFTDVPSWAEPYVAACYTNGITSGTSATTYGGSGNVTTAQAALMVMKALGYFQFASDFKDDWMLQTTRQANRVDLLDDVKAGVREAMTRNDVAQLVLNALEAGTVEADTSSSVNVTVGEANVSVGDTKYNFVTSGRDYAYAINSRLDARTDGQYSAGAIVELGEKLYSGDLTKAGVNDDLGRPATVWEYKTKEIGTFVDDPDYTWSSKVTSKTLYNAVGKAATDNYVWNVYVDGVNVSDNNDFNALTTGRNGLGWAGLNSNKTDDDACFLQKTGVAVKDTHYGDNIANDDDKRTGNGVVTEVFVSSAMGDNSVIDDKDYGNSRTVTVCVTHYYAAEIYKINSDVKTVQLSGFYGPVKTTDDFTTDIDRFEEDQVVLYSYSDAAKSIQDVYAGDFMEGDVTKVRSSTSVGDERNGDIFAVEGVDSDYKYNATLLAKDRLLLENVNNPMAGYQDKFGYVSYIDRAAVTYDYAYVLSMGTDNDTYGNENFGTGGKGSTIYARLVLTDGTVVKVQTNLRASDAFKADMAPWETAPASTDGKKSLNDTIATFLNHIVSYNKGSDGVYSLSLKDKDDAVRNTNGTGGNSTSAGFGSTYLPNHQITIPTGAVSVDSGKLYLKNGVAGFTVNGTPYTANSNTQFIIATPDSDSYDDYTYSVYQGIKNVPDVEALTGKTRVDVATTQAGVAKVVYIEDAEISGLKSVYFLKANSGAKITGSINNSNYYDIAAVIDGKATTLHVKEGSPADHKLVDAIETNIYNADVAYMKLNASGSQCIVAANNIVEDADGLVTNVTLYKQYTKADNNFNGGMVYSDFQAEAGPAGDLWSTTKVGTDRREADVVYFGTHGTGSQKERGYAYNDDTAVAWYDYKGDFLSDCTVSIVKKDVNNRALVILDKNVMTGVCVWEIEDTNTPEKPEVQDGSVYLSDTLKADKMGTAAETSKTQVNSRGTGSFVFDLAAPAWVADKATATFKYNVYVNGDLDSMGNSASLNLTAPQTYTYRGILSGSFDTKDKITVEVTEITYSAVKVQYVDKDGKALTTLPKFNSGATNTSTELAVGGAGANLTFALSTKAYDSGVNGTYTVTGLDLAAGTPAPTGTVTPGDTGVTVSTVKAKGNDYVTVTVTGLKDAKPTYDITYAEALANIDTAKAGMDLKDFGTVDAKDNALKVKLTRSASTGIVPGSSAKVSAVLTGTVAGDSKNANYKITVTIGGKEYSALFNGTTAVDLKDAAGNEYFTVNNNIEISKVVVTPVAKLKVTGAELKGSNTIVVTFNNNLEKDSMSGSNEVTATGTYSWKRNTAGSAAVKANYTVTFTGTEDWSGGTGKATIAGEDITWNTDFATTMGGAKAAIDAGNVWVATWDAANKVLTLEAKTAGAFGSAGAPAAAPTATHGTVAKVRDGADTVPAGSASCGTVTNASVSGNTVTVIFTPADAIKAGDVFEIAAGKIFDDDVNTITNVKTTATVQADNTLVIAEP